MLTRPSSSLAPVPPTYTGSDELADYDDFPSVDGPSPDGQKILEMLDKDAGGGIIGVMREYWDELVDSSQGSPIMRTYLAGLYMMANEYQRIIDQVDDANKQLEDLGLSPQLSNERSRLRDNISAMTLEGWKLQNALLDALNKFQSTVSKLSKTESTDPFDEFMAGD